MRGEERVELRLLSEVAKLDQERGLEIDTVEAIQCVRRRQSQVQRFVEGKRQRHWRVVRDAVLVAQLLGRQYDRMACPLRELLLRIRGVRDRGSGLILGCAG